MDLDELEIGSLISMTPDCRVPCHGDIFSPPVFRTDLQEQADLEADPGREFSATEMGQEVSCSMLFQTDRLVRRFGFACHLGPASSKSRRQMKIMKMELKTPQKKHEQIHRIRPELA